MDGINWWDAGATLLVLLLAGGLVAAMIWIVRAAMDDSDRHAELKALVETLFATPAHLQPGGDKPSGDPAAPPQRLPKTGGPAFEEPCPACETIVTERNAECPSCGLRLQ